MRQIIEGKNLPSVTVYNKKTKKWEEDKSAKMMMLPPKAGVCQECAVDHRPEAPHNKQSLFYQYKFYNEHGRWPGWSDAMAHCDKDTKLKWTNELVKLGEKV